MDLKKMNIPTLDSPSWGLIPSIFRLQLEFWIAGMPLKEKPWGQLPKPMTCYLSPPLAHKGLTLMLLSMQQPKPTGTKRTPKHLA